MFNLKKSLRSLFSGQKSEPGPTAAARSLAPYSPAARPGNYADLPNLRCLPGTQIVALIELERHGPLSFGKSRRTQALRSLEYRQCARFDPEASAFVITDNGRLLIDELRALLAEPRR